MIRADGAGLGSAAGLHAMRVAVLKAAETYRWAYHAALAWPRVRLPLVGCPTLLTAAPDDQRHGGTRNAAPLVARGRFVAMPGYGDPGSAAARHAAITGFLNRWRRLISGRRTGTPPRP